MLKSLNYPVMRFFDDHHCRAAVKYLKDGRIDYLEYYDAVSACWTFIITDSNFDVESALARIDRLSLLYEATSPEALGKIRQASLYGMMVGDNDET